MMTKSSELYLSIALVTQNRPESLKRCLKSWRSQTISAFEIVVSDDSDEVYAAQIQAIAKQFNCIYTRGPRRGLYANRNHASLTCRGTHILSADDDHTHPQDYVEKILEVVATDPQRVWIFPERKPGQSIDTPLLCPPELHRSGCGCLPKDPLDCAAIADGSSVYPRHIFDRGLRYDETYPFGPMWYLWGKVLRKYGWRISFSDATFIWHHRQFEERYRDPKHLQSFWECTTYVQFVRAWWVEPSLHNMIWSTLYLLRRIIFPSVMLGYTVKTRIKLANAIQLLEFAWNSKDKYVLTEVSPPGQCCKDENPYPFCFLHSPSNVIK